jgi:hypothetical protein
MSMKQRAVGRLDVGPSQTAIAWGNARCELCGVRDRVETGRKPLSSGLAGVVTCHRLSCGHAWHRTVAHVGHIFPGLVRNATFVPCDCASELGGRA